MKNLLTFFTIIILTIFAVSQKTFAATFYVGQSGSPAGSYFTDIQSAVYAASGGDTIIVSNGTYILNDQIEVTNSLIIQSVTGFENTIIDGNTSNRCFRLSDTNIVLDGFTITNGDPYIGNGGGVYCLSTIPEIRNCKIVGNITVNWGGGVYNGTINNCIIENNNANYGGGIYQSIVNNSVITKNLASTEGGGVIVCVVNNCTISLNTAYKGGGTSHSTVTNSIIYYNSSPNNPNRNTGNYDYCCTTPDGTNGIGNISAAPILLSVSYIATNSPCIGAGLFATVTGTDIDGESWKNPPAIGCDEPYANAINGSLSVSIFAERLYSYIDNPLDFSADISGKLYQNIWDLGDGTAENDEIQVTHSWDAIGEYNVVLSAYNSTHPAGVSDSVTVKIVPKTHYVNINNPSPVLPYSTWETAATNIQDAVDIADNRGQIIVTNGLYLLNSNIYVDKMITIESVNGPENTIIDGNGTNNYIRCFYLDSSNIVVSGFTITNGFNGGIYCPHSSSIITNCIIVGNRKGSGAGVYKGTVNNCIISKNSAWDKNGGGVYYATVNNCIISGNTAKNFGGGAYEGSLENCIVSNNFSYMRGGGAYSSDMNNCKIIDNVVAFSGGGIYYGNIENSLIAGNISTNYGGGTIYAKINECEISGNSAMNFGGGIFGGYVNNSEISGNSALIKGGGIYDGDANNCKINGNVAGEIGGGVYLYDDAITNCLISGMNSAKFGGGVYVAGDATIMNCTITGNNADQFGGGVVCSNGGTVVNTIIYDNQAFFGNENWLTFPSNIIFNFCSTTPTNNLPGGNKCISGDPMFYAPGSENYQLQEGSPCIDVGYKMTWMNPPTTDLAGHERIHDNKVDLGCYEFIPEPSLFWILLLIPPFLKGVRGI